MANSFNYFVDDEFTFYESKLKGETEPRYYVEGYASTIDEDLDGDRIEYSGQADLVSQMQGRNITLDLEHNTWFDENNNRLPRPTSHKIPVGKIVAAELKSKGAWVRVELNKHLQNFKEIWGSIKSGFLHAFSIGYVPRITNENGKKVLSLVLHNIAITGTPVNPKATFQATLKSANAYAIEEDNKDEQIKTLTQENQRLKSLLIIPDKEEGGKNMSEETKEETKTPATPAAAPAPASAPEAAPEAPAAPDKTAEFESQLKAFKDEVHAEKVKTEAALKSMSEAIEAKDKEIAELKAKLAEPMLKSKPETIPTSIEPSAKAGAKTDQPANPLADIQ